MLTNNHKNSSQNSLQTRLQQAENSLASGRSIIYRDYLQLLSQVNTNIIPRDAILNKNTDLRLFKLVRIVSENKKSILESTSALYSTLGAAGYSICFLIDSDGEGCNLYIGIRGNAKSGMGNTAGTLLQEAFSGHFPGTKLEQLSGEQANEKLDLETKYFKHQNNTYSITAVSGISSTATENQEQFMQGLEKFLDATSGRKFTGLIIADPIMSDKLNNIKANYENAATQLSPLAKMQLSYGEQESESIGISLCDSIGTTFSQSLGVNETKTLTSSTSDTVGSSSSVTKDPSTFWATAAGAVAAGAALALTPATGGASLALAAGLGGGVIGGILKGIKGSTTTGTNKSSTTSESNSDSSGTSKVDTQGQTTTKSKTDSENLTKGNTTQSTIDINNKTIEDMINKIDAHLERIDQARAYGAWDVASYFIADTPENSKAVACNFIGLMRGDKSSLENFCLNTWEYSDARNRDLTLTWLENLSHPQFKLPAFNNIEMPIVTPASILTSKELAVQLGLPRRSTNSVNVIEVTPFARQVQRLVIEDAHQENENNEIRLGNIRHLWTDAPDILSLDANQFVSHALITGTTGVGKTTTIMSILAQIHNKNIPFMVIEPAKGEYKDLRALSTPDNRVNYFVAGRSSVDALKINPFVFPDGIQLSDHVDRVCSVFNAAFTMYAAMPQVLEEAIFTAYEELGWDSVTSICVKQPIQYPTLRRVADLIPIVVKNLGYSEQLSSDYIGSLSTRLRSLCRGSLGMSLLCTAQEENSIKEMFETSCIVDLAAMGSPEKRALIMGILFMRLYEYRVANGLPDDNSLNHLMVLEEAHVLLKNSSTEQSQERSNPRGLAVESFANALAEMRAYGQGFIIADQSASVLDDCVLRNTNTKIVMRAPFEQDRITLAGTLSLSEEQALQLAKLENQTAIISQSNWLEPVLCRIKAPHLPLYKPQSLANVSTEEQKNAVSNLLRALISKRSSNICAISQDALSKAKKSLQLDKEVVQIIDQVTADKENRITLEELKFIVINLFPELNSGIFNLLTLSVDAQLNHILALIMQKTEPLISSELNLLGVEILRAVSVVEPQQLFTQIQQMERIK